MKCSKCQAELQPGVLFCRDCGTKVEVKKRFCRDCGAELAEDVKFCSACGSSVDYKTTPNIESTQKQGSYVTINNTPRSGEIKSYSSTSAKQPSDKLIKFIIIAAAIMFLLILIIGVANKKSNDEVETTQAIPINSVESGDFSIIKDTEYAYMVDEWNVYIATAISDSLIKIEKWDKTLNSSKSVDYDSDIGTYKINDLENGFSWIDDEQTAFTFNLIDKNNSKLKKGKQVIFTINISDSNVNKGSDFSDDIACYTYKNDDWHMYRAIPLTDKFMKIECWYRSSSIGKFLFGYDWCVFDITTNDFEFEWTDSDHESFTITANDPENKSEWKEKSLVCFELENPDYSSSSVYSYLGIGEKYIETEKTQKNSFYDNSSVIVGKYSFIVPKYWVANKTDDDYYRAYAETSDKVAMLQIMAVYDDVDSVTYDLLKKENDSGVMSKSFSSWFTSIGEVSSETYSNGLVDGFVYSMTFTQDGCDGECICLCFPSESDNKWFFVSLAQTNNTEYSYTDDFNKILDSISKISTETKPEESTTAETAKITEKAEVILPESSSKLGKDFDMKGSSTVYYINVDGAKNVPEVKEWGTATVTDGVAEYLDYLESLGFTVKITSSDSNTPYYGYTIYETYFEISNSEISWTMYLCIQDEDYVEYELDINLS